MERPGNFYERQIERLGRVSAKQAAVENVPALPELASMLDWFTKHLPANESTIIHGDYKMDNVVFHPQRSEIIGVLDWELCAIGHPLSDLANMLLPFYVAETDMLGDGWRESGAPPVEELLQYYCSQTNRAYPIKGWNFCVAFSFFRMAVILQGVAARNQRGQASSAQAELFGNFAVPSANLAWDIIRKTVANAKL